MINLSRIVAQLIYDLQKTYGLTKELTQESPEPAAANLLTTITTPIRMFLAKGPGYGDQVCGKSVIERLLTLAGDHRLTIDLIAPYQPNDPASAMIKIRDLFGVDFSPSKITSLQINHHVIRFIPYQHYHAQFDLLPEVQLSIFAGVTQFIEEDYLANNHHAKHLIDITKAQSMIIFDPFTGKGVSNSLPGYVIQLKHQAQKKYPFTRVFPYKVTLPTLEIVNNSLLQLHKKFPERASLLQSIIDLQPNNNVNTFAIYGLNQALHPLPEINLINLILSAVKVSQNKKLVVLLMSPLSEGSWNNIKKLPLLKSPPNLGLMVQNLPADIQFIDGIANGTMGQLANVSIIRLPSLPTAIFNYVFVHSDIPPTYEGANAATLLANAGVIGLPCNRLDAAFPVDFYDLPKNLNDADICRATSLHPWLEAPTPVDKITPLMQEYMHVGRKKMIEPDRVAHAIRTLSQTENCSHVPSHCAFYQPSVTSPAVISLFKETAIKHSLYSSFEMITKFCLQQTCNMTSNHAKSASVLLRYLLQFYQADIGYDQLKILLIVSLTEMALISSKAPEIVRIFSRAVIFFLPFTLQIYDTDLSTGILLAALTTIGLLSDYLTKKIVGYLTGETQEQREVVELHELSGIRLAR